MILCMNLNYLQQDLLNTVKHCLNAPRCYNIHYGRPFSLILEDQTGNIAWNQKVVQYNCSFCLTPFIFLVLRIGGWLGMTCPHGICYGLKWLLRHEGPRDHVDMIMNLAAVPNVVVVGYGKHGGSPC